MKFEVIDRDGTVKMSTEHRRCIYPLNILRRMETAGYKFRLDGKRWKPDQEINSGASKTVPKPRGRKETAK